MEEKKFVQFKEEELGIKEYIKRALGKGKISDVTIEYTPIGEKIIVATNKPGLVIGRKGEKIDELTDVLKRRFKLDNPHIEIKEISNEALDSQLVADAIALQLERKGSIKFKLIAYRALDSIMKSGALGAELVLSGRLPSERAKTWRFSQGYLKKTGEPSKVVERAMTQAKTMQGVIGIKVSILPPDAIIHDQIIINDAMKAKLREQSQAAMPDEEKKQDKKQSKPKKKKEKEQ